MSMSWVSAPTSSPRRFDHLAHFYLMPNLPPPAFRYMIFFTIAPLILLWIVIGHRVGMVATQSPYEGAVGALVKIVARSLHRHFALVVSSHGDFETSLFMHRTVRFACLWRWLMHHVATFALRRADVLRAVSNSTATQIGDRAPGKPLVRFAAWTDLEVFEQARRLRSPMVPPIILYAGVLIPRKGIHYLLDAFSIVNTAIPRARLIIVGRKENPRYVDQLRQQATAGGYAESVQFLAETTQQGLAERMTRASVFVLPSVSEGLGRVVLEAMAAGVPVVASAVGGIPDMVRDGETGLLVRPGDVDGMARALTKLMTDPDLAAAIAKRAQRIPKEFHTTESYIKGYKEVMKLAKRICQ